MASLVDRVRDMLSGLLSFSSGGSAIGVTIGASAVKVAVLARSKKAWKLQHFGMSPLPDDALNDHEIIQPEAVLSALKGVIQKLGIKSKNVCSAVSGNGVIVKRLNVEVQNIKELQDQVFWEAEQYLPFDVSEVYMDFQLLGKIQSQRADVLLVGVRKNLLDGYLQAIQASGVKPKTIDTEFFALQNTVELCYPSLLRDTVGIFDLGASSTKFVVIQNGIPIFTKESGLGGRQLTSEIQKQLRVSFQDAESLKVSGPGAGLPQEVSDLMGQMTQAISEEAKRSVELYNSSALGGVVQNIVLTGGSTKLPELSAFIEEATRLPTQILNPFSAIEADSKKFSADYLQQIAPFAASAIGLALRGGAGP